MQEPTAKILNDREEQLLALRDGLENLIAQLGTNQDKRHHSRFINSRRLSADGSQEELNAMYRTDWLSGKVVDIVPDDMTREWRTFTGDIDPEVVERLQEEEERLQLAQSFNQADKWARLYGTAFIVLSVDDGLTADKPLELDKIKPNGLRHIKVIDRHRVSTAELQPIQNPLDPNFGMPEFYRINQTAVKIHHSRLIRFDGVLLPYDEFRRNNYFSDSVLDRLYEAITDFNTTAHSASSMVYETNLDIVKVKGLMSYLQHAEGEALLRKRFTLAGQMKSFNNMLLLDNEEEFTTKNNSFAGLPDLLDRFAKFLAAATDIPATRLLGTSAQGLNATGEGDLKNYYDMIRSKQKQQYKPKLDLFDKIMVKSLGLPPETDLKYEFESLFQMTPREQSDLEFVQAQRDQIYLANGVINEEIVAKELKQNDTYTNITDEYIQELEEAIDEFNADPNQTAFGMQPEMQGGGEEESATEQGAEESGSQVPEES